MSAFLPFYLVISTWRLCGVPIARQRFLLNVKFVASGVNSGQEQVRGPNITLNFECVALFLT
jgi:hypothetical protein